jgi:hypothetical protein
MNSSMNEVSIYTIIYVIPSLHADSIIIYILILYYIIIANQVLTDYQSSW